jgi:hypothetical protein
LLGPERTKYYKVRMNHGSAGIYWEESLFPAHQSAKSVFGRIA